jgi:hypothetical protein
LSHRWMLLPEADLSSRDLHSSFKRLRRFSARRKLRVACAAVRSSVRFRSILILNADKCAGQGAGAGSTTSSEASPRTCEGKVGTFHGLLAPVISNDGDGCYQDCGEGITLEGVDLSADV